MYFPEDIRESSHVVSRLELPESVRRMPRRVSRTFSVLDIQGQWFEETTKQVWTVTGIVAERSKTRKPQSSKQSSKPVVLSDGPNGVEWGSGNLKGNMEGGYLVWRNRQGEATFFWNRGGCPSNVPHAEPTTIPTKPNVEVKAENYVFSNPKLERMFS